MRPLSDTTERDAGQSSDSPLVEMRAIGKSYGGVRACDDVDFTLRSGEVHALLGENGAGKSTLMKILSGGIGDYRGTVTVAGQVRQLGSPAAAHAAGISIIHQELDLVPDLPVAENLVLGEEPRTMLRLFDRNCAEAASARAFERLETEIDPRRRLGDLRIGEQQLVAIAKALSANAAVLVMDEPTSALGQAETNRLFRVIDRLRADGVGIVYISHYLEEVLSLADRITVLRDGQGAGTVVPAQTSTREIITMMVGRSTEERSESEPRQPEKIADAERSSPVEPVMTLRDLTLRPRRRRPGRTEPAGVSLTVHAGEIVGLAGLLGSGRTELLETVFGAGSPGSIEGEMWWRGGRKRFRSPRGAVAHGMCLIPEDRKAAGLFFEQSVRSNLAMASLNRVSLARMLVRSGEERTLAEKFIAKLRIRTPSSGALVGTLSGGNQQKVVIGRQLPTRPRLLLLDDPTRGVDVGAKSEIYAVLRDLAADGLGVVFASSELPELLDVCDRVAVLRHGSVVANWSTEGLEQERILAAAQGDVDE